MKLILASASPRRAEILRGAGLQFSVLSSAVDETPIPGEAPQDMVRRLALAKAELVAARAPSAERPVGSASRVRPPGIGNRALGKRRIRGGPGHCLYSDRSQTQGAASHGSCCRRSAEALA